MNANAKSNAEPTLDVVGLGHAIVDVLVHTDDAFLVRHGLAKGTMTLIDAGRALALHEAMGDGLQCSGGSAANTLAGVASLGGRAAFVGKVRDDALGQVFAREIRGAGVAYDTAPAAGGPTTARCLIFVTPDAQRTMQTYIGASAALGPEDVDPASVAAARITYLEGYLWDQEAAKRAFLRAAELAHAAGRQVALTLSDPFCVERHRKDFLDLVEHHVDILFANELEALALFETNHLDDAVRRLQEQCEVAVVTRSAEGSLVISRREVLHVPAAGVPQVVDTTGAGDLYAAGFLYGLCRNHDLPTCGRLGGIAAAEVISHFGARPLEPLRELASRRLREARP